MSIALNLLRQQNNPPRYNPLDQRNQNEENIIQFSVVIEYFID